MQREERISKATAEIFDVCIIGGGATGAGCALDAASRGLRTILIEKVDFGSATSSKSTKLIHGGVRYLEQAVKKLSLEQYKMVRKALLERSTLLRIAPHITRPLQLITPCRSLVEGLYYYIGLKLYDWISGRTNIGGSELLSKRKALERIPTLSQKRLFNAVLYYDGQLDDLRFNFALVQTAEQYGAICLNHIEANEFEAKSEGILESVVVTDRLSGGQFKVRAKVFVNATGPFADTIRLKANPQLRPRIRVSKGVHILLPRHMMPSVGALLIPQTKDGRLIFAIPYQKHLLVGTTDDAASLSDEEFGPDAAEVQYLLEYLNDYLDVNAGATDVMAGFGGLRPLIMAEAGDTKDLVRDHEVEKDRHSGLVSILGGKWTTYRLMAKDTIDAVAQSLNKIEPCITHTISLVGSQHFNHNTAIALQQDTGWDHELVKHLISKYGDRATQIAVIAKRKPALDKRITDSMPFTYAELQYVLDHEMAFTIKDVIGRRWGVDLANWKQALFLIEPVGHYMAEYYQWREEKLEREVQQYTTHLQKMMAAIGA